MFTLQAIVAPSPWGFECHNGERVPDGVHFMTIESGAHPTGSKVRLFRIWRGMWARCKPTNGEYNYDRRRYGGRGIEVCEAWADYQVFATWAHANGYADTLSIDRRDNDGNYGPENCWWADATAQARNTSRTVWVEHRGARVSLTVAAPELGIGYRQLYNRIRHKGMTLAEAVADIESGAWMTPGYLRMAAGRARKREAASKAQEA
jgi:hypothetical protein